MNFRYWFFRVQEFLNGNRVTKQIEDIRLLLSNPFSEQAISERENRLNKVLSQAVNCVPFYKSKNITGNIVINSFPVINKNIIRDQIDNFIVEGVRREDLLRVVTSGSTGTPFCVYHDITKKQRNKSDAIFFGNLAGFTIGIKLYYLKIWNQVNRKSRFTSLKQNINAIDVTQLSDQKIEKLITEFSENKGEKAFLGYASALESIAACAFRISPQVKFMNVKSVIAMSEGLNPASKEKIQQVFGRCPVSRYSNVENGIIAQQLPDGSNEFVINWASYYVEILDFDSDNTVEIGKLGRIVVTDLFNFSMPMIRYDTGDIGSFVWSRDKKQILLSSVEGRRMDQVFNTNGELVSSFTITNNMWLYPEIKQYQFIQKSKNVFLFKLNLDEKFEREALLISEFKKYFGQDAQILVEYVNEIPLLNSGKRKKVMNISQKVQNKIFN
jgi:phenylacetate-CoA ligase